MSDNRDVARRILFDADKTISKDRPGVHGSAENSFQMIGDMWTVYLKHTILSRTAVMPITAADVAQMMVLLKIARSVYGDPMNADNYVDAAGYSALAGMIALPSDLPPDSNDAAMNQMEKEIKVEAQ